MLFSFSFATYNAMGGHPVLSFAPNILLDNDGKSFGSAINEIEIYARVEPACWPQSETDFMVNRFRESLTELPKVWFRRKAKQVEIAYHCHVGKAEDFLGGDFESKKVPDVGLLRRTCIELAETLHLLKKCVKRTDDFDVDGFLSAVDAKALELNAQEDSELLLRLAKAKAAESERVARLQEQENQKKVDQKRNPKSSAPQMPRWSSLKNIAKKLEEGDGTWEDKRWSPLLLSASAGTEHQGRSIPVVWQMEFDPSDERLETANAKLKASGCEPDGYGWGEFIQQSIQKTNPTLANRLHSTDSESTTCVIWVETEADCKALLEATWKLIFEE